MNLFYKRLGFWLMSVLLMGNIGISQNNLSLQLTESSVLLDRLVVCGDLDFQRVIFSINGENLSARQ